MWSAIKNDLFEFVQTVQSDTTTTLAKVIETSKSNDSNKSNEVRFTHLLELSIYLIER